MSKRLLLSVLSAFLLTPSISWACACGCGVFDVGTGTMLPTGEGGTAWIEYNYMNQNQNWSGASSSDGTNNPDKQIRTNFFTAGTTYMFNRQWGAEGEIPFWDRKFKTQTDDPNPGDMQTFNHANIGDVRVKAIYSGLSDDMSTGLTFGLKLATGDFTYENFDRDTAIGSGSTDLLLGGYHMGDLSPLVGGLAFSWFATAEWSHAFIVQQNYRPGDEFDAAIGSYYNGFDMGSAGKFAPMLQIIGSIREHDIGMNSMQPINGVNQSGYQRLLLSPGIEYDYKDIKLYGDVEVPVYQYVNGNQLIAPVLFKFIVGYNF